jgi:transcriptional regulator with XRE-family HTH domain
MLAHGWNLSELARQAGVSVQTLNPQHNKPSYSLDMLVKIAPALGTTVGELLGENERGPIPKTRAPDVVERIQSVLDSARA